MLGQALAAHNKSIHTRAESGRLKAERLRGIGEGEKGLSLPVETYKAGRD